MKQYSQTDLNIIYEGLLAEYDGIKEEIEQTHDVELLEDLHEELKDTEKLLNEVLKLL